MSFRLNAALAVVIAESDVVVNRAFVARVAPEQTSAIAYRIAEGTKIKVLGLRSASGSGRWLSAIVGSSDSLVYLFVRGSNQVDSTRRLGKALREILVPSHPAGLRGAIDTLHLVNALRELRQERKDIRWISMAVGAPADSLDRDSPYLMLTQARAMLRRELIDGRRTTSVAFAPDVPAGVLRVRVFGWEP